MQNEVKAGKTGSSNVEANKVASINALLKKSEDRTKDTRDVWEDNYILFAVGPSFAEKEDWQSQFSVSHFANSIRTAQGKLVNIIVNSPDWWDLEAKNDRNGAAQRLRRPMKKLLGYFLEVADFKRYAGTFFMQSLISLGVLGVGFRKKLVLNPEWVLRKTEEQRKKEQRTMAPHVANPETAQDDEFLLEEINKAVDGFVGETQGEEPPKAKPIEQYVQYGTLDFWEPMPKFFFWEPSVSYLQDSPWVAFQYQLPLSEVKRSAKMGLFSKAAVKRIPVRTPSPKWQVANRIYQRTTMPVPDASDDVIITAYFGPLYQDGAIVRDNYFCVIANDSVILKEGDYPYWEPPMHRGPVIAAAVRQIPHRATGAGIGDQAKGLQRQLDQNLMLLCDSWRLNIGGINVVNRSALVDKSTLDEGIYPGKILEIKTKPSEAFERVSLTSNVDNQVAPINEILRQGINDSVGNMDAVSSGPALRSRTSAKEISTRVEGAQGALDIMALDLEQIFLIPILQKCLARVLQYGIPEVQNNVELRALFDEEELQDLLSLTEADRLEIINSYYKFKISGFSANQNKAERATRVNELLQIGSSNPLINAMLNWPEIIREWATLMDLDPSKFLVLDSSEAARIIAENQVLLQETQVVVNPNDNDELHLQLHAPLASSELQTEALVQHVMMHQQQLEQKQAGQAGGGQGLPPEENVQ